MALLHIVMRDDAEVEYMESASERERERERGG